MIYVRTSKVFVNALHLPAGQKISTKDAVEKVVEVARQTHGRCPIHATVSRATEMIFKLIVNGTKCSTLVPQGPLLKL